MANKDKEFLTSLMAERLSYVRRGLTDRVKEIDVILKRYAVADSSDVEAAVIDVEAERAVAPKVKRKKREV